MTLTKACLPVLLPHLTTLFNQSLSLGHFPTVYKLAAITPVLKKPTSDPVNLSNYRPISNLSLLSKTLERIVSAQLHTHLQSNNLYEPFQSGFRQLYSTETALVKVTNDLLISADSGALNILLLLDLSTAFDTVNYSILLQRLRQRGVEGTALDWLTSYLANRNQFISLSGHTSILSPVTQGVPQGSVLGPLLFICYLFPLGNVIRKLNLDFHCDADDTQIYIRTTPTQNPPLTHFETCISTIKTWLTHKFLKLNSDKAELLLLGTKSSLNKTGPITFTIDSSSITPSPLATLALFLILHCPSTLMLAQLLRPPSSTSDASPKSGTASLSLPLNPSSTPSSHPGLTLYSSHWNHCSLTP
nr:ubiquinone biosynthesis protein COQ9, mitochondrial isoform X3 [Syngnathus scovelli]